jgi:hypothetical protein
MAITPEGKIKKKIDAMLKSKKGVWFFKPQSGQFGSSGIPDYIVCNQGFFMGIEAKSGPTKKPTDLQLVCMSRITDASGTCFVVYDDITLKRVEVAIDAVSEFARVAAKYYADNPAEPRIKH